MIEQRRYGHVIYGRVAPEAPCKAARRRHSRCRCRVANREQWSGPEARYLCGTASSPSQDLGRSNLACV